jgi:hypothetical protein
MIETSSKHHYDSDGCDMVLLSIPQIPIISHYSPCNYILQIIAHYSPLYPHYIPIIAYIAYIAHVL